MAGEALTEPLLPRGRDDSSTPPAHSTVNIAAATTATAPAPRRAINVAGAATAKFPAFAALENASASASASTTAALASASPASTNWQDRPANPAPVAVHREDAALKGLSASPPATPSPGRRANPLASHGPASGADASPRPASPANVFIYPSISDALRRTASSAAPAMSDSEAAPISPIQDASPSLHRVRNSPGIPRSTEIKTESVGADSDDGSTNNCEVERIRRSRAITKSSFRTPRGRRLYRRVGLRRTPMPVPQKDTWNKESFLYTCVLVLLVGLVAYLSTMLDGWSPWSPYLRGIFIGIFGAAAGLACIGAMVLISETPDPPALHFAHIVSRLTFIVGSLAFEAVVFYLLGEDGFIAWLVVAAITVLVMTYIWRVGSPESFSALVSYPGSVYRRVMGFFRGA